MRWLLELFSSSRGRAIRRAYEERDSLRKALVDAELRGDTRAVGKLRMKLQDQTTYCLSLSVP